MSKFRVLLVILTGAALGTLAVGDDKKPDKGSDNAKLLVGVWEASKASEKADVAVGDTVDFGKDGKLKVSHTKKDGKVDNFEATYKVDGDKLIVTLANDGSGSGSSETTITIKKLTDTELVMVGKDGETVEWKRKKAS